VSSPIHDRIRKLLALAADASAGEAETAAAMAARLMAEHSVTLADVAASSRRERPAVGCRRIVVSSAMWETMVIHVVAQACGGRVIRDKRGSEVSVLTYAPEATIDSLLDLAAYIRLQVLREAAREVARVQPDRVRAWKRSFIVGAISRAGERLRAQRRAVAEASREAGTALAKLDDEVEREVQRRHPRLRSAARVRVGAGYDHGRAAGDRLDVGATQVTQSARARLEG
jgi:hypothetical protein